ncbi:MAG TPA: GTPase [Nocardioidaceae bacterium]|nr:GTPase [Nocardioidaceae bacterium]
MSAVVDGAKKLLGKGDTGVAARVEGLQEAVEAARGRLPDPLVEQAHTVASRAATRLRLSGEHTVVALAGATGSGKSSTFNALTGMEFAAVGVRRPTTSWTMSCVWGEDKAGDLLDWIGVPPRHRVSHDSMLDVQVLDRNLEGLVLLDLPDHDSTEKSHHVEMQRLVELGDLIVWVLDPQKYADAAIHDRFLMPLASHKDVMLVVLNHIDEVPENRREALLEDLRRLLRQDGLHDVPLLTTSAKYGDGIPELKEMIAKRVTAKQATLTRLLADVTTVAATLSEANGVSKPGDVARHSKAELVEAFADAAGVPTVVDAVEKSTRRRAAKATGWPLISWLGRFRSDPLKRLHLDLGPEARTLTAAARTSLPEATPVQRARVDTAVRSVADNVAAELSPPWAEAVRRASTSRLELLNDALDKAVGSTDLGVHRTPLWWRLVRFFQVVVFLAAVVGAGWLTALAASEYLQFDLPDAPEIGGLAVPTFLLLAGVAVGVLVGMGCRFLVGLAARSKARTADQRLRAAIADVTEDLVIGPIEAEIDAYRRTRHGLNKALVN